MIAEHPQQAPLSVPASATVDAIAGCPLTASDEEILSVCMRAHHLAEALKQHYWRSSAEWDHNRQTEAALLLIRLNTCVDCTGRILIIECNRGKAVRHLHRLADLFDRALQVLVYDPTRSAQTS